MADRSFVKIVKGSNYASIEKIMMENIPTVNTFAIFIDETPTDIERWLEDGNFVYKKISDCIYIVPNIIICDALSKCKLYCEKINFDTKKTLEMLFLVEPDIISNFQIPNNVFIDAYWGKDSDIIHQIAKGDKKFSSKLNKMTKSSISINPKGRGKNNWKKRSEILCNIREYKEKHNKTITNAPNT